MILILLMNALFAATFPLGKDALAYASPTFLTGLRMACAGALLLLFLYLSAPKKFTVPHRADRTLFIVTSLFYTVLSFIPEFWALQYLSSLKTNLLWSAQPFIAALLGYFLLRERLSSRKLFALALGITGLIPIMLVPDQLATMWGEFGFVTLPELALIVAVVSTVFSWFLIKRLMDRGYSLTEINGYTMLFGGLVCLMISGINQSLFHTVECTQFFPALLYALILVGISNIGAYMLYGHLMKTHSVTLLSFSGFTCPVFGMLISYFITGEPIYTGYIIGFCVILTGLYIFYQEESRARA